MAMNIQGRAPHRGYPMEVPLPPISSRDGGFGKHFGGRGGLAFNDSLSPAAASNPMAIRGSYDSYVPPPLPPPTLVPIDGPVDPNIQFKERRRHGDHSSPLGDSLGLSFERRELPFKREREFPDEGYQSIDSLRFVVRRGWDVSTVRVVQYTDRVHAGLPTHPLSASRRGSFAPTAAQSTTRC